MEVDGHAGGLQLSERLPGIIAPGTEGGQLLFRSEQGVARLGVFHEDVTGGVREGIAPPQGLHGRPFRDVRGADTLDEAVE